MVSRSTFVRRIGSAVAAMVLLAGLFAGVASAATVQPPPPTVTSVCAGDVSSVRFVASIENTLCTNLKNQLGVTTVPPEPPSGATPAVLVEYALLLVAVLFG